ncbi:conserved hypothetical protein [Neospora caninum Liverpool]|uniref:t-SNARE coiled-coil homology domain-containing protein n=1 Tax=Neospora caninum (strain Liverpool) TaxID=572307 RepID=F0VAN5_NEOCL|nr:conserved hypothetical protein [Neospora caninum Liverpool]CBZ50790.1 conserved hypothetical protein [Neospora caninum Liverpool]CEL68091.1 TPA: hypothetical protein BN1204_038650 [Neospora caninum Liverpool]|eukprot:XP_003880823.1 conserved hypothetical protein [Neospora caninum Liverpool]
MCDRTPEFRSRCKAVQEATPSLRALCDAPLPAPPFPFASQVESRDPASVSQLACSFVFLEKAALCAAEQRAVERQLRAPRASHGLHGALSSAESLGVTAPGADAAVLLKKVHRQQAQLQELEKTLERWEDVACLARGRAEWEEARERRVRADPGLWRSLSSGVARVSKGSWAPSSEAAAHRHAVLGCLYAQMKDLANELKQRELAALQGRMDSRRYFSAFGNAPPLQAADPARQAGVSSAGRGAQRNSASRAATLHMQASLAAAEAAKTAERILLPKMHKVSTPAVAVHRRDGQRASLSAPRGSPEPGPSAVVGDKTRERGEGDRRTRLSEVELVWAGEPGSAGAPRAFAAEAEWDEAAPVDAQRLAREEHQLVETLSTDADLIQDVQAKLTEIVHCMDVFSAKVLEQSEACTHIRELADAAVENVDGAERHLTKAMERTSAYRYYVLLFFLVAGWLVLLLDFVKSSRPYL